MEGNEQSSSWGLSQRNERGNQMKHPGGAGLSSSLGLGESGRPGRWRAGYRNTKEVGNGFLGIGGILSKKA